MKSTLVKSKKPLIASAILGAALMASPATASVYFDTSNSQLSCGTAASCVTNSNGSISVGGSTGMTLSFLSNSNTVDATSNIQLGHILTSNTAGTSGDNVLLDGIQLIINVYSNPPDQSGNLPSGSIMGTLSGGSSNAEISWVTTGIQIGDYFYQVTNNPLGLVTPNGAQAGDTTIQGRVTVPEPATWAMMLLGFVGIGAAMRRVRRPALAQLA